MRNKIFHTVSFLIDKRSAEILGEDSGLPELETPVGIVLTKVTSYRQTTDDISTGELSTDRCMVFFDSGDSLLIGSSYEEFDLAMRRYHGDDV